MKLHKVFVIEASSSERVETKILKQAKYEMKLKCITLWEYDVQGTNATAVRAATKTNLN